MMPWKSKADHMRDHFAFLKQKDRKSNIFYNLPDELQRKILFINVVDELQHNPFLGRKQHCMQLAFKSICGPNGMWWGRVLFSVDTTPRAQNRWNKISKNREDINLDDVYLCKLSHWEWISHNWYWHTGKSKINLFKGKKKELQQRCEDNGLKWSKSWTNKQLCKKLMTI
jgi:hypothetical protein